MSKYCGIVFVFWDSILVQVTIYRRFLIGRDDRLDISPRYIANCTRIRTQTELFGSYIDEYIHVIE